MNGWCSVFVGTRHASNAGERFSEKNNFPLMRRSVSGAVTVNCVSGRPNSFNPGNHCASRGQFTSRLNHDQTYFDCFEKISPGIFLLNGSSFWPQPATSQPPWSVTRIKFGGSCFFSSQPPGIFLAGIFVHASRSCCRLFSQSCARASLKRIASANSGEPFIVSRASKNPVSYTHLRAHETDPYLVC